MISIYVHIPFCIKKCSYCDFFSLPISNKNSVPHQRYCGALLKQFSADVSKLNLGDSGVSSVYFGGGTPSVMPVSFYEKILWALGTTMIFQGDVEITCEVNPGTVDDNWFKGMVDAGVNRFSIGVQTFDDSMLKSLGRIHSIKDSEVAIAEAQDSGVGRVSIDLMYGLPGQSLADIENDLRIAMTFQPDHISAYQLTIETGTELEQDIRSGKSTIRMPSEDEVLSQLRLVRRMLQRGGWDPYEISNFARPSSVCRHNLHYWRYGEYLGLGSGATSFLKNKSKDTYAMRWTVLRNVESYLKGNIKIEDKDKIGLRTAMGEYCFMGLRTSEGISLSAFKVEFGVSFDKVFPGIVDELTEKELVRLSDGRLSLTEKGVELSNTVFREFVE